MECLGFSHQMPYSQKKDMPEVKEDIAGLTYAHPTLTRRNQEETRYDEPNKS